MTGEKHTGVYDKEDDLIYGMFGSTIAAETMSAFACFCQLIAIIKLVKYRGQDRVKNSQKFIQFLILINLSIWLFETFSAKDSRTNPFMIRAWGEGWHKIDPVLIPPTIFFYFHSAIILIKLRDGHYDH